MDEDESKDPRAAYEIPKSIPVVVENTAQNESRYIEICHSEPNSDKEFEETPKKEDQSHDETTSTITQSENPEDNNPRWNRTSVASLNLSDKKYDRANLSDKRSSTASLGDKFKSADGMKQSGSYARLVGNGESVTSLSDWRRVKKIANDERERLNMERNNSEEIKSNSSSGVSPTISYSMVTFPQASSVQRYHLVDNSETARTALPKVQRSKSNLQTSKANIPLVINSGLLNMLRQAPEIEDDSDSVTYANIDSDNVNVTDL